MPDFTEATLQELAMAAVNQARGDNPEAPDVEIEAQALTLMSELVQRAREAPTPADEGEPDPWNLSQLNHVAQETAQVRAMGERFGYGRVMQLCEEIWGEKEGDRGGQHTVGPCAAMLVPCPGVQHAEDHPDFPHCDWCCGSHRVTQRVAQAIFKEALEKVYVGPREGPSVGPSRYEVLTEEEDP